MLTLFKFSAGIILLILPWSNKYPDNPKIPPSLVGQVSPEIKDMAAP